MDGERPFASRRASPTLSVLGVNNVQCFRCTPSQHTFCTYHVGLVEVGSGLLRLFLQPMKGSTKSPVSSAPVLAKLSCPINDRPSSGTPSTSISCPVAASTSHSSCLIPLPTPCDEEMGPPPQTRLSDRIGTIPGLAFAWSMQYPALRLPENP